MAPGSHDYYLSVVAQGAEDYYLARGEAPGRWLGRGLEAVALEGRVEADQLRAVLAGDDPRTGERLSRHPARTVPGFDLTFRAPKSVSLLWGLGDLDVADQVRQAHDAAVDAAVGYLEREAARTRRGAGGTERVEVDGLIAAAFRHRTSRAGDPLLHTHVLVANLVRASDDGIWRTLESRRLFLHAKTAGYLYQAQLRHELADRLGLQWGPVVNGHADLAGIPRDLIDAFSRRRREILERLEERGESSARAAQVATLETRVAKEGEVSEHELRATWAKRAQLLDFDPASLDALLHQHAPDLPDVDHLAQRLVGAEELTANASTFAVRDLVQAVAQALPDGAPVQSVEAAARDVLALSGDDVVALGVRRGHLAEVDSIRRRDGSVIAGDESEPRLTTRRLLLAEQQVIATAGRRSGENVAVVPTRVLQTALDARPSLSDEQAVMVRRLTADGDGVAVVLGRAGTGKTFALDAARDAWTRAGIPVRGVALAARAARELQDSAGIPSTTIHKLLAEIDAPTPGSPLAPGSVLVVDEAGMVGTRTLARLLDHADRQHVKVVLVGDPRQLPEIDAGGLFGHLARRLDAIELIDNRRQRHAWEITALDELRHGDPSAALAAYADHDRITTADTAETLRELLVSDWWDAYDHLGATSTVMVAVRQVDVDDLNDRARQRLHTAGLLTGPSWRAGSLDFRVGDRVLCLRNNRRIGVDNGTLATVQDANTDGLEIRTDDGRQLTLPAAYLKAGHVTHGYAITGHKAQGLTVDQTFVLGSDQLYREWGYVAMSRGRESNRLYVHPALADPHGTAHGHQPAHDPLADTAAGLRRSQRQAPAVALVDDRDLAVLADTWRQLQRQVVPLVERHDALVRERHDLLQQLDHLDGNLRVLHQQRHALHGGLTALRKPTRERRAELDATIEHRDGLRADLAARIHRLDGQLAELPDEAALDRLRARHGAARLELWDAIRTRLPGLEAHPPAYVLTSLGAAPDDPGQRRTWREALTQVEAYRACWNVNDPRRALGDDPIDQAQRAHRQQALHAMLAVTREQAPERGLDRPAQRVLRRGISR